MQSCDICQPGFYGLLCQSCGCASTMLCSDGITGDGSCFCPSPGHNVALECLSCNDTALDPASNCTELLPDDSTVGLFHLSLAAVLVAVIFAIF